jgi:DNA (cytosine-5)-methyltransferase 1
MKGVPEHLVANVGITLGHEILGQAVVYTPFRLIAKAVAEAIKRFAAGHEVVAPMAGFKAAA